MSRFKKNSKKHDYLNTFPEISLHSEDCDLSQRMKFNFSYFEKQNGAGQSFQEWSENQKVKLWDKLGEYSKKPISYWQNQRVGGGGLKVMEIYKAFPLGRSDFSHPKHIPVEVWWARFRLESKVRLVGFIIPPDFETIMVNNSSAKYCLNTFYVVFLDKEHKFYKVENK